MEYKHILVYGDKRVELEQPDSMSWIKLDKKPQSNKTSKDFELFKDMYNNQFD